MSISDGNSVPASTPLPLTSEPLIPEISSTSPPESIAVSPQGLGALSQQLFVEQYKATRAEILLSVQTSQRMLQFLFTAIVAINGFSITYIVNKSDNISISNGYMISFVYGFILCFVIAVMHVAWFMEMLRLTRVIVFLKYLEDKLWVACRDSFDSKYNLENGIHFSKYFGGYVIFWENWVRGNLHGDFSFISRVPYSALSIFIAATAALSYLLSFYLFKTTVSLDVYCNIHGIESCNFQLFGKISEIKITDIVSIFVGTASANDISHLAISNNPRLRLLFMIFSFGYIIIAILYILLLGFLFYWNINIIRRDSVVAKSKY